MADNRSRRCSEVAAEMYLRTNPVAGRISSDIIKQATQTIRSIPYKPENAFTICDYGVADGGASVQLIKAVIREVRQSHDKNASVVVIYEDQPTNDFKTVFLRTQGFLPETRKMPNNNVYYFASGTNFYEQCCPPSSVHFGYTCLALHWLSTRPCPLSNTTLRCFSSVNEAKEEYVLQSARDWECFLLERAKELVPGGVIIASVLARDIEGNYGGEQIPQKSIFNTFDEIWQSMTNDGIVSQEEYQSTKLCTYFRSASELRAPFTDANSDVVKAGLVVESCEISYTEVISYEGWLEGRTATRSTAEDYANVYTTTHRAWSESSFLNDLDPKRTAEEKKQFVDTFFQRIETLVASEPELHHDDTVLATLSIRKLNK